MEIAKPFGQDECIRLLVASWRRVYPPGDASFYQCQRCAACCFLQGEVRMARDEISRIAKHLGMNHRFSFGVLRDLPGTVTA